MFLRRQVSPFEVFACNLGDRSVTQDTRPCDDVPETICVERFVEGAAYGIRRQLYIGDIHTQGVIVVLYGSNSDGRRSGRVMEKLCGDVRRAPCITHRSGPSKSGAKNDEARLRGPRDDGCLSLPGKSAIRFMRIFPRDGLGGQRQD